MCLKGESTYFVLQRGPRAYCIIISDFVYDSHSVYAHLNSVCFILLRKLTTHPTGKKSIIRNLDLKSMGTESEQTDDKIIECLVP